MAKMEGGVKILLDIDLVLNDEEVVTLKKGNEMPLLTIKNMGGKSCSKTI